MASSYRFRKSVCPHSCTSFSYVHYGPPSSTSTSIPAYKYTAPSPGLRGSFSSRVQSLRIVARTRHLSSLRVLTYHQVSQLMGSLNWASGLIPLGRLYLRPLQRHFHSLGLTDRFTPPRQSDPLVLANLLRHWQDLHFLTSGIPIRTFRRNSRVLRMLPLRGGTLTWGIPRFRVPGPIQTASSISIVWSSRR